MPQELTYNLQCLLYSHNKKDINGCVLEGGSRSRKTCSGIEFLIIYCQDHKGKVINIIKETYASFKVTLFNEFKLMFDIYGISSPFDYAQEIKSFNLLGNKINLLGVDKLSKTEGVNCDIFWINEALPISQQHFDQFEQRCEEFWFMDYNPRVTIHWIYDKVCNRPDVEHFISTMLDNPYTPEKQKRKILSYNPGNPENIKNGTADEYMHNVYCLGKRGAMKGLIFKYVNYIDSFPDMAYDYGMDFGFTVDPLTIVKCAENKTDMYIELLCYEPIETPEAVHEYAIAKEINIKLSTTADSSDKHSNDKGTVEMVNSLRKLGWNIHKVSKTQNVMYWLGSMKNKKINIVNNDLAYYAKIEAENYKLREINGIAINQPIDKFNHFWDAARYRHMAFNNNHSFNYQQ